MTNTVYTHFISLIQIFQHLMAKLIPCNSGEHLLTSTNLILFEIFS